MRLKNYNHLGNTRATYTTGTNGSYTATQGAAYFPIGLAIDTLSYSLPTDVNTTPNPYLYNGKELQTQLGLQWLDYGARMYDAQVGRWWSVDPMAEKRNELTPYQYAQNNPILRIDPNGMLDSLYLSGAAKHEAFKELQKSTSLTLEMNDKGKINATGEAKQEKDQLLLEVINSDKVDVNILADTKIQYGKTLVPDGAFMGNIFANYSTKAITQQIVNPFALQIMDEYYGKPGANMLHEVAESFVGGLFALATGVEGGQSTNYELVHNIASVIAPQSGPAGEEVIKGVHIFYVYKTDSKGNEIDKKEYNRFTPKQK